MPVRQFRILFVGHGEFAAGLLAAAEMICGSIPEAAALGLEAGETPDTFAGRLRAAAGHDDRAVLVLADLLGGTPYNTAAAMARRSSRIVCISGANLAIAVEAALSEEPLTDDLVERLIEAGQSGIVETSRHHARRAS